MARRVVFALLLLGGIAALVLGGLDALIVYAFFVAIAGGITYGVAVGGGLVQGVSRGRFDRDDLDR